MPEDQNSDAGAICPYCLSVNCIEASDYTESGVVMECQSCEKSFHYLTSISVSHETSPDCELNGSAHKWFKIERHPEHLFCEECGKAVLADTIQQPWNS